MAWRVSILLVALGCHAHDDLQIVIDGEWTEPAWNTRAHRGVFHDATGGIARPYSEVRMLFDADSVYVALYAADEDIRSSDAFELVLGARTMRFTAAGSGPASIRCAVDRDGTLDQSSDDDEEWVVEAAIPRAGLPAFVPVRARRCDVPKDGHERCGEWAGTLALPP